MFPLGIRKMIPYGKMEMQEKVDDTKRDEIPS